jgi:hypothetical protein
MMNPRSESDIIKKTITLKFGEKEYEVPVLTMLASARWRKEWADVVQLASPNIADDITPTPEELRKAIGYSFLGSLIKFPDKLPDLVFSYAPSLPKDEILEKAYDHEFSMAFKQIWQVAFEPFLELLGTVQMTQRATASHSGSSGSLN